MKIEITSEVKDVSKKISKAIEFRRKVWEKRRERWNEYKMQQAIAHKIEE